MKKRNIYIRLLQLVWVLLILSSCGSRELDRPIQEQITIKDVKVPKGFKLEELYKPNEHDQGSWVSITKDDQGRLYTSDQFGYLYRVTLPTDVGSKQGIVVDKLDMNIGLAQGLLWHKNVLYALVNSNVNRDLKIYSGFYKITDSSGDGQFDKVDTLRIFEGSFGEHGPHNIELSPDKKSLYLVLGNRILIPEGLKSHVPKVWGEDNILPTIKDPSGHVNEIKAPGGWVAKVDIVTEEWTVHNVGMRNTYDMAFNQDGELFGFDSDMELDMGMPWYRPIRLCHFTSGSEFGWRSGTGKFIQEYPDNLPGIINIGQGSPTGVMNGEGLKFPSYYQNGLYLFDWSYGTMYFASLKPKGSSYNVELSEFISGVPLPLTNGLVGDDGAMYFLTGGRRLESTLYKLTYEGKRPAEILTLTENEEGKAERSLRKKLEALHVKKDASQIGFIIENLDHADRFSRFAARVAMEHQDYDLWKNEINKKVTSLKAVALSISIAHLGTDSDKLKAVEKLLEIDFTSLSEERKIDYIRGIQLLLIRSEGEFPEAISKRIVEALRPSYLISSNLVNKELCKVLSFLQVADIIEPTLEKMENDTVASADQKAIYLSENISKRSEQYGAAIENMLKNMPNPQNISYAKSLSVIKQGWAKESRERYFKWYRDALTKSGGNSYAQFIRAIQEVALTNVPLADRQYFESLASEAMSEADNLASEVKQPKGPGQNWTVETVKSAYLKNKTKANFENGQNFFKASLCANCHSIKGVGRNIGPELTQVGTRFSISDLAEAIVNPSSTISDRYRYTSYHLEDGRVVTGKVIEEDKGALKISTNAFSPDLRTIIRKSRVEKEEESLISPMPPGLINRLNEQELTDLIAFLVSGGNQEHEIYNN
ncbi:heme-binding protein [Reichenbachiella sp. MALMAid0571]|uniref:heme-binding protein n=1 Tax=Reichenbachiella sp. MALMAid0571 TaxID=3143939 RepID=UPI0032DE6BE8